jgi:hypothetical protein
VVLPFQLTPCISSLACYRSTETIQTMSIWAQAAADTPTANMTPGQVNAYMEYMCAEGHTGPVCGACLPKYGHSGSGHTCVKCLPRGANNFAYFLVCCFMMLVPAMQMVMHAKGVMKSTELVEEASKLSVTSTAAAPPHPAFMPKASQSATGAGAYMPVLKPVHETGPGSGSASFVCPSAAAAAGALPTYVSPSAAAAAAAAAGGAGGEFLSSNSMGKDVGGIELAPMQHSAAVAAADGSGSGRGGGKSDVELFRADQGVGGGSDMVSPFSDSAAVAGAMAVSRDESAMSAAASTLSGGHPSQVGLVCAGARVVQDRIKHGSAGCAVFG